jgi:hypothetical protein
MYVLIRTVRLIEVFLLLLTPDVIIQRDIRHLDEPDCFY